MKHIRTLSLATTNSNSGGTYDLLEEIVLLVISMFFSGWDNYSSVMQNLEKFYEAT